MPRNSAEIKIREGIMIYRTPASIDFSDVRFPATSPNTSNVSVTFEGERKKIGLNFLYYLTNKDNYGRMKSFMAETYELNDAIIYD